MADGIFFWSYIRHRGRKEGKTFKEAARKSPRTWPPAVISSEIVKIALIGLLPGGFWGFVAGKIVADILFFCLSPFCHEFSKTARGQRVWAKIEAFLGEAATTAWFVISALVWLTMISPSNKLGEVCRSAQMRSILNKVEGHLAMISRYFPNGAGIGAVLFYSVSMFLGDGKTILIATLTGAVLGFSAQQLWRLIKSLSKIAARLGQGYLRYDRN